MQCLCDHRISPACFTARGLQCIAAIPSQIHICHYLSGGAALESDPTLDLAQAPPGTAAATDIEERYLSTMPAFCATLRTSFGPKTIIKINYSELLAVFKSIAWSSSRSACEYSSSLRMLCLLWPNTSAMRSSSSVRG